MTPKILIVCGANQDRSPALAALLQRKVGDRWHIESAGLEDKDIGNPPSEHTLACMAARDIDLSAHRSQPVWATAELPDMLVCLTPAIRDTVLEYLPRDLGIDRDVCADRIVVPNEDAGGISDPHGGDRDAFEACFAHMEALLSELIEEITARLDTA